ncbi:MAG: ATP synthase F1 subunit delta [Bacteroidetes bacterium]|jgi:F-type H+-transporting ATPase subunit delta|nr:ATP synthase F1 subunit delta [Bacteroidota bacterium]
MSTSRIASRYSKSLIEIANASGKLDAVKSDMEAVSAICSESKELINLLKNPIVNAEDKKAVLTKVFANTNETTQEFIGYLADKKRESELPNVAEHYVLAYNKMKGIANATVVSAEALSKDAMANMKNYVSGLLGKKDIELSNEVDPFIIGGVIIKHEDRLLDKSVSKELREIRKKLIYN